MKTIQKTRFQITFVVQAAIIAALYVVFTLLSNAVGLASGVIQVRISEAFCILAVFTPAAIPGLTIGCLLANFITGCLWQDIMCGSIATLIGAVGAYLLRKLPIFVAPLPTILANMFIVPWVLKYAYGVGDYIWYMMLTVGAGELIAAGILGVLLYFALRQIAERIFGATYCGKKKDESKAGEEKPEA